MFGYLVVILGSVRIPTHESLLYVSSECDGYTGFGILIGRWSESGMGVWCQGGGYFQNQKDTCRTSFQGVGFQRALCLIGACLGGAKTITLGAYHGYYDYYYHIWELS